MLIQLCRLTRDVELKQVNINGENKSVLNNGIAFQADKNNGTGFQPDWTELYPILKEYESEVDCEHYYKIFENLFDEVKKRYGYTSENAMLVIKDMLAKSYFRKIK